MVALTPEMAGTGLIGSFIVMLIALVFNIYMLWLNWKQSKVRETTEHMLEELVKIRVLLSKKSRR